MDGQIRRGARRAHRHSRRRRRVRQSADARGAQAGDRVRIAVRRIVHGRDRHAGRDLRLPPRSRPSVAGTGVAELDDLSGDPARLLSDVLPLPASDVALPAHRLCAASSARRGIRRAARRDAASSNRGGAMTALLHASKPSPPNPVTAAVTATLIIVIPIFLALVCFAAKLHVIELSHTVRAELLFALLLGLMASGMPISIALGLSVLTYLFILSDVDPKMVGLKLFTSIDRFEIMAIPFFILAGNFLTAGGVARRMIDFATSMIGHWYGGLGLAGVVACALFAAISGSSVATVVGIGSIILPALIQQGYPPRFSAGVIATSGALGILFPPSINLVIYAVATSGMQPRGPTGSVVDSASIGQLFIAALVPGLILSSMLGATTWYRAWRYDYPRMPRASWRECWRAFRESVWGLLLILLVLGGIYSGLFTPTEAAACAAVYAFFIAVFVYKGLKFSEVPAVLLKAASMSAMILYIITNAAVFSWLLTSEQIPQSMAEWMTAQGFGIVAFLLVTNIVLLAAGNFMDPAAITLIMAPILFPMAAALGVHPVHLGILMAVNMEVGLCHPPVGLNLYVASGITKMGIGELTVAVLPWLGTMLIFLVMVTYIPEISLWLPRVLGVVN